MLYFNPEVSSSVITYRPRTRLAITAVPGWEGMREVSAERACFILSLPLRYSILPVRRRLIRMMLTLQKYGETGSGLDNQARDSFTPSSDYVRSVIDNAMLRGELRCRPSGEMAHAYLKLTEKLQNRMAGLQHDKALLRKEVRHKTTDFLLRYAADAAV